MWFSTARKPGRRASSRSIRAHAKDGACRKDVRSTRRQLKPAKGKSIIRRPPGSGARLLSPDRRGMVVLLKSLLPFDTRGPLSGIARHYAWTIPVAGFLGFVGSALEGIGIGLIIPLIAILLSGGDIALGGSLRPVATLVNYLPPRTRLAAISGAILGLIVLKNVVYIYSVFAAGVDGRACNRIRCALADRLMSVGYPFFMVEDPARTRQYFHGGGLVRLRGHSILIFRGGECRRSFGVWRAADTR